MIASTGSVLQVVTPVRVHGEALVGALEVEPDLHVVATATDMADAASSAAAQLPDLVLLDFGVDDLVACVERLRRATPSTAFVVYGVDDREELGEHLIRAAQAGASSFVDTEQPFGAVVNALQVTLQGESYCSPRVAGRLLHAIHRVRADVPAQPDFASEGPGAILSRRERTVAALLVAGLTNRQIAARLVVSEATVKSHVHAILHKLGVRRREEVRTWFARAAAAVAFEAPPRLS